MNKDTNQCIDEKFFAHELGDVIRGSKDWFGGRRQRFLNAFAKDVTDETPL